MKFKRGIEILLYISGETNISLKSFDSFDLKPDLIPDKSVVKDGISKNENKDSSTAMHSLAHYVDYTL